MTRQPLLLRLKQETRERHNAVEQQLNLSSRLQTKHAYLLLLERLYGFYMPMESQLDGVRGIDGLGLELGSRRKTPLLLLDLHALGRHPRSIPEIALCGSLPALDNVSQALGCLYVLEGATLGGKMIGRELEQRLGLQAQDGGQFFASYGAAVAQMWKTFGEVVAANSGDPQAQNIIINSSCATFDAFGRWFQQETTSHEIRSLEQA